MRTCKSWFPWIVILLMNCPGIPAESVNPDLLQKRWPAKWISPPDVSLHEYGVYHFRKSFDVPSVPDKFIIHVSADNRYRLFVNGEPVCSGPARGDLWNWRFETADIAKVLKKGRNVLAAVVWNFADLAPWAQMTDKTAFLVQGNTGNESAVNTPEGWRVLQNRAYTPAGRDRMEPYQFIVVGPGDRVDGAFYPWAWQEPDFEDSGWVDPVRLGNGTPRGMHDGGMPWMLVPRNIPLFPENIERIQKVRRVSGIEVDTGFLSGTKSLSIPPHSQAKILLDQTFLTVAYPELRVSKGKGSSITLIYAEALVDAQYRKGHRDDIQNRFAAGLYDHFLPDGGEHRLFRPLWLRTYRYIQMEVETGNEPLLIEDIHGMATGYPFEEKAVFQSSDRSLDDIWNTGWRTARLCAGETYFDCPYYEQMQYAGDTRIQALISLYVSGDDRLMRNAILQFHDSRFPDGLTASRYPSRIPQVIPPYSLFWIAMIHDYWMHREDEAFIGQFLGGIRGVLEWYERHIDETGMLGPMPWWNFVDWPDQWAWNNEAGIGGIPTGAEDGHSSIISLQFAYVLDRAARLMDAWQDAAYAQHYRELSEKVKNAVLKHCWREEEGLIADAAENSVFSQHANVMAVLTGLIEAPAEKAFIQRVADDETLIQCTFYYRFYLNQALKKAGLADQIIPGLSSWRDMLKIGLTTFAERPEPTRSDCHAWSAAPNYDFLATVCGIVPDSPGFKTVRIEPGFGPLDRVLCSMPHPQGMIRLELKRIGKTGLKGGVDLPSGVTGVFLWNGRSLTLRPGRQDLMIQD
ncbi:alpha-L-rhamnosidase [bacterium]|nr:alpha-L-rhamnosidase [bacterium]